MDTVCRGSEAVDASYRSLADKAAKEDFSATLAAKALAAKTARGSAQTPAWVSGQN